MKFLSQYQASIRYRPMEDEVDYNESQIFDSGIDSIFLPSQKSADPLTWAAHCIDRFGDKPVYILIPGRRFDIFGTRHGRGTGWYDRFLSGVPTGWLRIGIVDVSQLSTSPLKHKSWDEPVDWIAVYDAPAWNIYKTNRRHN
ncbi:MAG: hypothetical protein NUV80_01355 [Candidatus Berkelbacteria bacterium]|nr:hypothetical protein [Candidatus Berkelbacteria bacterium]